MSTNAGRSRRVVLHPLGRHRVVSVGPVVLGVLGGIALRLVLDRTPLWLDEAQSVAIAAVPLSELTAVLRQDGHPPLYYAALHLWMGLFGRSDVAVRSLSVVVGVAALAPLALIARRVAGRVAVGPALALGASSPFLVRYSTETRMYALVVLLALSWWLALLRATQRPTVARLAVVALLVAAVLYTQYWGLFLLAAGALPLAWRAVRRDETARSARLVLAAHAVGAVAFLPWLPSLWVQLQRTGTPWAAAPNPLSALVYGFADFAGGWTRGTGLALFGVLLVLVLLGAFGRALDPRRIEVDLRGAPPARPVVALVLVAAGSGLAVVWATQTAFASRYLSIIVGFVLVLAARGVVQFANELVRSALLVGAVSLGLAGSWFAVSDDRSQGSEVATAIATASPAGSVVVTCPDQLGPAVARYLPGGQRAVGYPTLAPAGRVDWTDYAERNAAASVDERADRIVELAAGEPVWLAWHGGYRTLEGRCEELRSALAERLGSPIELVQPRPGVFEPMWLTGFGSTAG